MKQHIAQLAIAGGEPAFAESLHVGRPNIGNRERLMKRIEQLLDNRWLTNNGPQVQELEQRLADLLQVKHCIAMCNGTIAMEIAIRAVGLTGEVIIPSMTFIATAHALQWQEITPVFCDTGHDDFNLDSDRIESLITPRTSGIIGVHLWGVPCPIERLEAIAQHHRLHLLFDAAHALGSSHRGKMIGGFGEAEVFSFHATKFVNAFEGGAVATNNDELAKRIRLMKNFGFGGLDTVVYIGTNGKMSEVSAAMALTSLEAMDNFIDRNRQNYAAYQRELSDIPGIELLEYDQSEQRNFQYIVARFDTNRTGLSRDQLIQLLHAENVIARRYFYPGCHRMEPYRSYQPHARLLLPNTESLAAQIMVLPTGTAVTEQDISEIAQIIRLAVESPALVTSHLARQHDNAPTNNAH